MTKPKLSGKAKPAADKTKNAPAPAPVAPAPKAEKPAPRRRPAASARAAAPATRGAEKASSSSFVSVACKVPNGIMLQNYRMVDAPEAAPAGTRMVKKAEKDGPAIRIHGTARRHGFAPRCPIVMGFAITKGVPIEHWERWLKANKDSAIVKNGLIFANPDMESVREEARDNRKQFSGMEPLAQRGDPRAKALTNKGKKLKIEQAKESNKGDEPDFDTENVEPDED